MRMILCDSPILTYSYVHIDAPSENSPYNPPAQTVTDSLHLNGILTDLERFGARLIPAGTRGGRIDMDIAVMSSGYCMPVLTYSKAQDSTSWHVITFNVFNSRLSTPDSGAMTPHCFSSHLIDRLSHMNLYTIVACRICNQCRDVAHWYSHASGDVALLHCASARCLARFDSVLPCNIPEIATRGGDYSCYRNKDG